MKKGSKIRIIMVDDHDIIREGLGAIIAVQPDMELVGQASDGIDGLKLVRGLKPDVILLDLVMPRMNGLEMIREVMSFDPHAHILVLTSFADDEQVFPAIKAGALGYLLKDIPRVQLLQAIRDVADGQAFLHPAVALKVMREINGAGRFQQPDGAESEVDPLTDRELETLRLIARGLSNQEIANELVVHERTIAKYVSSILDKLHLANRTQAALYALRNGISVLQ